MKRKLFSMLMAVLLLMQIPVLVSAEEGQTPSAAVRAAYWTDGTVHIFSDISGAEDARNAEVTLMLNNQVISRAYPVPLGDADATAHYLLLVDRSLSMGSYRNQVFSFVKEALKAKRTDLKFSVAFFDGEYQLVESGLETYNEIRSALWTITCNRDDSDIGGAVAWALEYLGENPLSAGDVNNLVVITDGEPWYSSNAGTQSKKAAEAAQNASAMMAAYPDITVHTLCFGDWDQEIYNVLSTGRGLHFNGKASNAGKTMAAYSDDLCLAAFPMAGYEDEAYIVDNLTFCMGTNLNSVGRVRNLGLSAPPLTPVSPVVPVVPAVTDPVAEPTEPSAGETDPTQEPADPTEDPTDPTEGTGESTAPSEEAPAESQPEENAAEEETSEAVETETTLPVEVQEEPGAPSWVLITILAFAAVVILAVVLVVLKKNRAPAGSVRMGVEVLSGNVLRLKKLYHLSDQILIGTDKSCHIVIDDPGAAPVNTRIFKQGQMIYIEDMDSPGGTYLGGMRLYSSNRLRSGDDVTIGTVTLRILF